MICILHSHRTQTLRVSLNKKKTRRHQCLIRCAARSYFTSLAFTLQNKSHICSVCVRCHTTHMRPCMRTLGHGCQSVAKVLAKLLWREEMPVFEKGALRCRAQVSTCNSDFMNDVHAQARVAVEIIRHNWRWRRQVVQHALMSP